MAKTLSRDEALVLLHKHMKNQNLRRHCYAVESVMRALATRFSEDENKWGVAGLLHDADYELTKNTPNKHTRLATEWLEEIEAETDIRQAILAHGWGYVEGNQKPITKMEWSLYCCDELTGLIVAVALVKEDKKLASVTVDSILRKWKSKAFARGVNRGQIEQCEEHLDIPLPEFIEIALLAMQKIAPELGL
ncbi:hypothetical protein A2801_03420 [Candidatus Woesebacteria bacterium RIFCSPHIGHO2_01_FULL_41_10]|uniref:HD domain-containing protein n=1 Tax=Candidatus Woesebacteria bacterium RIFCSPHIGHO2_01_FULL_41_10 TaxID=1802500 RepID=A0A1F7YQM4_9BACT|nr:MAG: hypothetical protein A2801_03420 [Candidatus Woesebacteria bacterium RIFCSPHIGHO2_01_FULL_41_10]